MHLKTWPIIRHVRYFWIKHQLENLFNQLGARHWQVEPTSEELNLLEQIWKGDK